MRKSFASDNNAGIHPDILKAIEHANQNHTTAYGNDKYTDRAVNKFKEFFGEDIEVFFVFNGTSANVLGLSAVTNSYNSILCSDLSHINVDECNAPEKFTGCKLSTIRSINGKISIEGINNHLIRIGDQHAAQPKVVSLTQSTEYGTVYTVNEIKDIVDFCHKNNLLVHVDGARLSNAAVTLHTTFKKMITETGVDILSFGGTKNGLMLGEAVVFLNKNLADNFQFIRKQGMQLASKMRFISAQFEALLSNDLWAKNAEHSNQMAKLLSENIQDIKGIKITQKVDANAVFAVIPEKYIASLQEKYNFYVWNEKLSEVRLMCSFDTTEEDVNDFSQLIRNTLNE